MKKLLFVSVLTAFIITGISASAQDVIIKTDGSTILSKVEEISSESIKYRKWDNIDGPVYTMLLSQIDSIKFSNGTVEVFKNKTATDDTETAATAEPKFTEPTAANTQAAQHNNIDFLNRADLLLRARRYNIGGAICVVTGSIVFVTGIFGQMPQRTSTACIIAGTLTASFGGGYCCGMAARLKKEALEIAMTSPIMEMPLGNTNTYANVCVMSNSCTHSSNLGAGLSFRF